MLVLILDDGRIVDDTGPLGYEKTSLLRMVACQKGRASNALSDYVETFSDYRPTKIAATMVGSALLIVMIMDFTVRPRRRMSLYSVRERYAVFQYSKRRLSKECYVSEIEKQLSEAGIELPEPPKPAASYIPSRQTGGLVYVSGQDCRRDGTLLYEGKLGSGLTVEQGQEAARQAAINCLAVLRAHTGSLEAVSKVVEVFGIVNSAPGFVEHPYVINGASDLLEQVFGEAGRHSRIAFGTSELPFNTPVEVKAIFEVR